VQVHIDVFVIVGSSVDPTSYYCFVPLSGFPEWLRTKKMEEVEEEVDIRDGHLSLFGYRSGLVLMTAQAQYSVHIYLFNRLAT